MCNNNNGFMLKLKWNIFHGHYYKNIWNEYALVWHLYSKDLIK